MKKLNENDFNLIENFISGKLTPYELKKFEGKIQTNTDFIKYYQYRIKIEKLWNDAENYQNTKNRIKQIIEFEKKKKKKQVILWAAASIAIMFGIAVLFSPQVNSKYFNDGMVNNENDSALNDIPRLFSHEQPEKGNLYSLPLVFNTNDTLFILRKENFPKKGEVILTNEENKNTVLKKIFSEETDSILIPLQGIIPGRYRWEISGTDYSGNFILEKILHPNN
jgi:hypothetical protein